MTALLRPCIAGLGERRVVQRGAAVDVRRGHRAGHRPQQVPHRAEQTPVGRPDDVVAASGGHGPPREGTGGRVAKATTETQKIVEHVECFLFFLSQQRSVLMCIDVYCMAWICLDCI